MYPELIRYSQHSLPTDHRPPEEVATGGLLPLELLTQREIRIPAFNDPEVYDIHSARYTATIHFQNQASRNNWV